MNSLIKLHKHEYEVLKNLINKEYEIQELSSLLNIPFSTLYAWIEEFKSKNFVITKDKIYFKIYLTEEGKNYAKNGLPEERLIKILKQKKEAKLDELEKLLGTKLFKIALINSLKKNIIKIKEKKVELIKNNIKKEKELIEKIYKNNFIIINKLNKELEELKRRKIINIQTFKQVIIKLNTKLEYAFKNNLIQIIEKKSKLTHYDIITGNWEKYELKPYNISALPPKIYFGRSHIYIKFLEEVKKILLEMGFEEAEGNYIESEFWNFDILFVPQDHPAREVQATFRLHLPLSELDEKLVKAVKIMHEKGGIKNSIGWRYSWNAEIARRLILRTHTTTVSVRYLYENKNKPAKVFCISRNFRYDIPDPTHSMEFYQCEGIMVGKDLNFSNLLAFLKEFSFSLGLEKIKFKPAYFPFTEPSVEGSVFHKRLGWIEALPGGMFRPEVLNALEIKMPVLAWGIGIDRLAMAILDIDDIRELFSKDLNFLREKKMI